MIKKKAMMTAIFSALARNELRTRGQGLGQGQAYLSPIPQNLVLEDPVPVIVSDQKCFDHITEKLWIRCYTGTLKFISCCYLLVGAVRRNPETARATDSEIENEIKAWLKFAKDRDGGRHQRYQMMLQNAAS